MIVLDLNKNEPASILNLTKELPDLKKLKGMLNWDPHPLHRACVENGYDLDIFLIATGADGKVKGAQDVIFFNNKTHASGALSVPVDNQTGEGDDDEFFIADLPLIPADINEVHVYVFIHEAARRGQNFGMIANTGFEIADADTGVVKVRYQVTQEFSSETALHVATIARNGAAWEIRPVGTGGNFDPNQVMSAYI